MEILESMRTEQGRVVSTVVTKDGKKEQKEFSSVRCGLALATPTAAGYWIVLGQEHRGRTRFEGQVPEPGRILFLAEHLSPSMFFPHILDSLTDAAARYHFSEVFLDYDQEEKRKIDEVSFLNALIYEKRMAMTLSFSTAPFYKDFYYGISIINSFLEGGVLVLPDQCLAREQLKNLQRAELAPGEGETKFAALNALRFVAAAFHRDRAWFGRQFIPNRRHEKPYTVRRPR